MERSEGDMSLKNPVTPPGIDPGTVRLVAQRLNHYATLGYPRLPSTQLKCGVKVKFRNFKSCENVLLFTV
jgi:hypothetical protein